MPTTSPTARLTALVVLAAALPLSAGCASATLRLRGGRECVELKNVPRASERWIRQHSGLRHQSAVELRVPVEDFKRDASRPDRVPANPCPAAPRGPDPEEEGKELVRPTDASNRTLLGFVGTLKQTWPSFIGKL
jgi:hypothetical protein